MIKKCLPLLFIALLLKPATLNAQLYLRGEVREEMELSLSGGAANAAMFGISPSKDEFLKVFSFLANYREKVYLELHRGKLNSEVYRVNNRIVKEGRPVRLPLQRYNSITGSLNATKEPIILTIITN